MAEDFGNGVTRTLSALARQFSAVVWQSGKPPLDSELNLMSQVDFEALRQTVRSQVHSGFFLDPTRSADDYKFHSLWANHFHFGKPVEGEDHPHIYAAVNGMVIPVAGVDSESLENIVRLSPPPSTDARTDFVFLEVWRTLVAPNPSTENKPNAAEVYKYGNTQHLGMNIPDDLQDPAIGIETTERVQIQYRIRVHGHGHGHGSGTALDIYPDGFEDPNIMGQGAADSPVESMYFHNMRNELGDPSLWRAGNGNADNGLGTVDGYVYAIPICAIFRRNANPYKAIMAGLAAPNHNGSGNRTPGSSYLPNPKDGAVVLTQCVLHEEIAPEQIGHIDVDKLLGSGLEDPYLFFVAGSDKPRSRMLVIGEGEDEEYLEYDGGDVSNTPAKINVLSRGRGGSMARRWPAGTKVRLHQVRPDDLYADQIVNEDVLDLRRGLNFGDWDYERILLHNVAAIARGDLKTAWKQNGAGGDSQGPTLHAVDYMYALASVEGTAATPDHTDVVDGLDGVRKIWSDAAVIQSDITCLLDWDSPLDSNNLTVTTFTENVNWEIDGMMRPTGFMNKEFSAGWSNGCVIFLHIGGEDGEDGIRRTFRDKGERAVRFLSPYEMWKSGFPEVDPMNGNQYPWTIRFQGEPANLPMFVQGDEEAHPGPLYPWRNSRFEKPFLFLGGLAYKGAQYELPTAACFYNNDTGSMDRDGSNFWLEVDLKVDWAAAGVFGGVDDNGILTAELDPTKVSSPLLHGQKTLYDLLTAGGQDRTGESSELYLVLYGDTTDIGKYNNGAWKIVGIGQTGWTDVTCNAPSHIAVQPVCHNIEGDAVNAFGFNEDDLSNTIQAEIRTQHTSVEDGLGSDAGESAACIVLTDIAALSDESMPWSGKLESTQARKMVVSGSVMYSPSRGATTRVPDQIERLAVVDGGRQYLKNDVNDIDLAWNGQTSHPVAERHYHPTHIQLWNRLPSLGWHAPMAPHYGGRVVLRSEQDRECELFVDHGSKTIVFQPFQRREMTLRTVRAQSSFIGNDMTYLHGLSAGFERDSAKIWTSSLDLAFALPQEVMPRFGRQDIPVHARTGDTDNFMSGINHLFVDTLDETEDVFAIIGGEDNEGDSNNKLVEPMLFQTDTVYGKRDEIVNSTHPTLGARKSYLPEVISSDLGYGMRGIELPPNYGVARVYGIYERQEFEAKIDDNNPGGFESTGAQRRIAEIVDPPTNLLKTDGKKQTLFIRQGGGYEYDETTCTYGGSITGNEDDHTYIIPSEAIDHTLAANWSEGKNFEDMDYVVECVVFGFARGFINKNNYVLARKHSGVPDNVDTTGEAEYNNVQMVIPAAGNTNDASYLAYERTPYQGDPYMTHDGDMLDPLDFQHRYGNLPLDATKLLETPIKQFDEQGNLLVDRPNPRGFEILASVDFYTTMGTGKVAGKLYPGTFLDIGVTKPTPESAKRIPSQHQLDYKKEWRIDPRAYTEGQLANPSRAYAELVLPYGADEIPFLTLVEITITKINGDTVSIHGIAPVTYFGLQPEEKKNYFRVLTGGTEEDRIGTIGELFLKLATHPDLRTSLAASINNIVAAKRMWDRDGVIRLESLQTGSIGNKMKVSVKFDSPVPSQKASAFLMSVRVPTDNLMSPLQVTSANFAGGVDIPMNAGLGESQLRLTGMTERLPLGILLKDSDFICENPLRDRASAFRTATSALRPIQDVLPLAKDGQEYTRFFGAPGELLAMSDGQTNWYTPYMGEPDTGTGTRKFRLHRGGGAVFNLSGKKPGGPVDWVSESMPESLDPVMKGGALACKAMLVRNFYETAFSNATQPAATKRSDGDEIQLIIVTHGSLSNGNSLNEGITINGEISPTGFGEGYAAADRYRVNGRPMHKGRRRDIPDPAMPPLAYPGEDE